MNFFITSSNVRPREELRAAFKKAVDLKDRSWYKHGCAQMGEAMAYSEGYPESKPLLKFIAKTAKITESARKNILNIGQELYMNYLSERIRFLRGADMSFREKVKNVFNPDSKIIPELLDGVLY